MRVSFRAVLTVTAAVLLAVGAGAEERNPPVFAYRSFWPEFEANERLVAIHTAQGGEKTVTLPMDCRQVRELYTGKTLPVTARQFRHVFKTPDTALFELIR